MVIKKNTTGRFTCPSVREFGFRNPVNFCLEICRNQAGKFLVEFGILGVGIRNTLSSSNPDPANDWNPNNPNSPDKKMWNPVPGIRNPQLGIHNPRPSWIPLHGGELYCSTVLHVRGSLIINFKKNNTLDLQVIGVLTYLCL